MAAPTLGLSKVGQLRLGADYLHEGSTRVSELFALPSTTAALGRADFSAPMRVLAAHLVETVADVRLLIVEQQLREIGLPLKLCVWLEEEVAKLAPPGAAPSTPHVPAPLPPIPLSAPVRPRDAVDVSAVALVPARTPSPAAAAAAAADDNSTLLGDDAAEEDPKQPLALLASQLANLSFADGVKDAPKAMVVSSGLAALGSAGLFTYSSDFDKNGIIYALATCHNTRPWTNPLDAGLLRIHASSLMEDSAPLSSLVGRDTVRCVTKPIPHSWVVFDFLSDKRIHLTHYSLKHYLSWDTEALRCWRMEASSTGDEHDWHVLREHVQDENLHGKGGTFTWSVAGAPESHKPFRYLRILQTAENSNKHHYLALSGIELYGRLLQGDAKTPYVFGSAPPPATPPPASLLAPAAAAPAMPPANGLITFKYRSDFDQCGVLYWLATSGYTRPWRNPAESGLVRVAASSLNEDSEPLSAVVGQAVVRCVTQPLPDQWIAVDLGAGRLLQPSAYSLRHYSSWDTEALRNWRFQASTESDITRAQWVTLLEHREDEGLNGKGSTKTWALQTTRFFRMFRVLQFDKNSNKHHYLALSGFELYGTLKLQDAAAAPDVPMAMPMRPAADAYAPMLPRPLPPTPSVAAPMSAPFAPLVAAPPALPSTPLDSWDPDAHGAFLVVGGPGNSLVRNTGSSDKWQLCRATRTYSSGVQKVSVKIVEDPNTTNTWRFILGVVPTTLDCKGPKQWVGVSNSWGYIGGTGGKCHTTAVSAAYGAKFVKGDVVTIVMHFEARTLAFFRNDESQGVAFADLQGPVHLAASLTATESVLQIVPTPPAVNAQVAHMMGYGGQVPLSLSAAGGVVPAGAAASNLHAWDPMNKSTSLVIEPSGMLRNSGSNDKWQSCRSIRPFSAILSPRARFDVELVDTPRTNNSWQVIVGVVPPTFTCSGTKQWVGAGESWGYIGGTGGKCCNVPKSVEYGAKYGAAGDVISVLLDFHAGTIEFRRNGVSQGIAFTNLSGTVYAAVSLTATGASAKLTIHP